MPRLESNPRPLDYESNALLVHYRVTLSVLCGCLCCAALCAIWCVDVCVCVVKVLDGLGVGPSGPPIPPPVTLAILPYPVERPPTILSETSHVCFVPLPEEM